MSQNRDFIATNRANWNERADIHMADETGFYRIDNLLAGANLLTPIERSELGDITGQRVAHLQCHIGTDTLSLKRLGAAEVAGLDFSGAAIGHAQKLAERTGLEARFVEGVVYDAPTLIGDGYDLVFTSWGTIVWMDDLPRWARAVVALLKPGGRFYYADCHPLAWMLASNSDTTVALKYDYETRPEQPLPITVENTYTFAPTPIANSQTFEWSHGLGSILNALVEAGLVVDVVNEHEAIPWLIFDHAVRHDDGLWRLPQGAVRLPLSLSIQAHKPL